MSDASFWRGAPLEDRGWGEGAGLRCEGGMGLRVSVEAGIAVRWQRYNVAGTENRPGRGGEGTRNLANCDGHRRVLAADDQELDSLRCHAADENAVDRDNHLSSVHCAFGAATWYQAGWGQHGPLCLALVGLLLLILQSFAMVSIISRSIARKLCRRFSRALGAGCSNKDEEGGIRCPSRLPVASAGPPGSMYVTTWSPILLG